MTATTSKYSFIYLYILTKPLILKHLGKRINFFLVTFGNTRTKPLLVKRVWKKLNVIKSYRRRQNWV